MRGSRFLPLGMIVLASLLSGCAGNDGFADLDRYMKEADEKPRGKIDPLPEVQVYKVFTYGAAGSRSPFVPPAEVIVSDIQINDDQSNVKPDLDRPLEVLESFSLSQLKMVGTLQRGPQETLWALIADNEGGVHMIRKGQYMGRNHGKIMDIAAGRIDLLEIVPNGSGGWLERPQSVSLEDE